jgi:hypothetical protein
MPGYFATPFGHWVSYKLSLAELALRTGLPTPRNEAASIETYLTVEIREHLRVHAREIEDTLRQQGA